MRRWLTGNGRAWPRGATRASPTDAAALVRAVAGSRGAIDGLARQSRMRFMSVVAVVMVAGSLSVGFAWASRQYNHPTLFDSWENAYGVFDCTDGSWLEPFESVDNQHGIRTRGDGVIYIEPTSDAVTGDGARFDVFLDSVGVSIDESGLRIGSDAIITTRNAFCDGEEAVLQIHRWDAGSTAEPTEIITSDLDQVVFREDGQSFTLALAPLGAVLPAPPNAAAVAARTQHLVESPPLTEQGTS